MLYRFADCTLDTQLYSLERAGQRTRLAPKVFEVLCYLLAHRDRVVSKQELCEQVWEGLAISDATLESCLRAVRTAIGDSGQAQRIIQTQRGYGYRFVADVTGETPGSGTAETSSASPGSLAPLTDPALTLPPAQPVASPRPGPQSGVRRCAACQYANDESAVFCAACGTRLRQLCVHCGQVVPVSGVFCTACGQPLAAPSPPSPAATPAGQAERKPVTVLCCAVAAPTAHGTPLDLDALHSLLLDLHALAQGVVGQYGGRLHPMMGERLLAMFGVPVAHEDDARRAVHVALELRRRLAVHQEQLRTTPETPLVWRMGLHTGLVVVEGMRNGEAAATAATVVGNVVSVATALAEQAAPGTILCSDATVHLLQGTVRLEAQDPLQVPGQSAPVETYAVLGRRVRRSPVEPHRGRGLSPFVGREREMTTLQALLAQAEAGHGQVVGVVGEPGLGKSRLVYEFHHSLGSRRLTYRTGRCLSYGTTTPYLPVLDLLRHHCGMTDTDGPEAVTAKVHRALQVVDMAPAEWAPVLLHLLGIQEGTEALAALSPEARKVRLLTALTQMCLNGSRQRPLILEIEDLHWIDASSDACLAALVERMAGAPLLVLVTYRPGYRPAWMDRSYVTQIALQPLTSQDSLRVLQGVLPTTALPPPLVPQLLAKAEGNPFFLEELARTVVEQGPDAPSPTVPDTVQAVLLARIDRLPTTAKRLLQAAAVIGKDIALPLLQAVTDVPEEALHRDLGHLQAAEFLYETYAPPTPGYTFKHALTQEVAYQSLVRRARQQYHARIAQVLEERFPEAAEAQPELLAYHYTEAGLGEQAIPYWQRAGQRAVERSAHVEAIGHCTQGLALLKTFPETSERVQQELALQLAIGPSLLMLKGHAAPEVEQAYTRAYALAQQLGETPQRFSVLVGLWRFYYSQARLPTARELAEQCFVLAQHLREPASLQEAHTYLGSTLFIMGDLVAAHAHLEQGIALYDPQQSHTLAFSRGTDPGVVCLSRASWGLWWLGYPEQALARSHEAIALAQRLSHPGSLYFALHYNALLHVWCRKMAVAQELLAASITFMREHGFVQFLGGAIIKLGWVLVEQGGIGEGIAQIRQGLEAQRIHKVELGLHTDLAILAQAYGRAKQAKEGLRVLGEALERAHNNTERFYEPELYRLKGELLLQSGTEGLESDVSTAHSAPRTPQAEEAEACFHQAISLARHQSAKSFELRVVMSLSRLWQRQGKQTAARQLLAESYSWFTEGFDTPDLQEAQALLAVL